MKRCVFCQAENNLNNSMTIKYGEEQIIVHICDAHAETATLKSVKEAYNKRREEFEEYKVKLEAMGYKVVPLGQDGGLAAAQKIEKPTIKTVAPAKEGEIISGMSSVPSVPQPTVDTTVAGDVTPESPYKMEGLKGQKKTKLMNTKGRAGSPLSVPSRIEDETGVTNVQIVRGVNNQDLLNRIEVSKDNPDRVYGYTAKDCIACNGLGTTPDGKKPCPKCGGRGLRVQ